MDSEVLGFIIKIRTGRDAGFGFLIARDAWCEEMDQGMDQLTC